MSRANAPLVESKESANPPRTKGASDWVVPVVAGLACFLLSPLSFNFSFEQTRITLVWTIVIPLTVSLARGPRAGLISGLCGGALYPFLLWPENGYANILYVLLLFPLYILVGAAARHPKIIGRPLPLYVRLALVFTTYSIITGLIGFFTSNLVLSLNSPFWPGQAVTYLPGKILFSIPIKSFVNQFLLIVLAESLLHLPAVRRLLKMKVPSCARNNQVTFFLSILAAAAVWGVFFLLDCLLIGAVRFQERAYVPLALMVLLWSGALIGRVLIYTTEHRLKLQDQRIKLLHEKEILLEELHHRTNNNMQVIQSFIMLEQSFAKSSEVADHLQALSNRIEVMSLAHKKLYQSGDLSSVHLRDYLNDLIYSLPQKQTPERTDVVIETSIDDIQVLFDIAIPIGLVIYELTSNSLRHAFPDRGGAIFITVTSDESDAMSIIVRDTGVGLTDKFDFFNSDTLGIQIVIAIVKLQLNGTIRFDTAKGLTCSISFRNDLYFKRV